MAQAKTALLLTRPRASSEAFLRDLGERYLASTTPVVAPLQEILSSGPPAALGPGEIAIFTSQHAPLHVTAPSGAKAYCVGDSTAAAARAAGFKAISASGDASDLRNLVLRQRPDEPLVYFRGRHISEDIVPALQASGLTVTSHIVYEQRDCPVDQEIWDQIAMFDRVVALVFSPRSATILARQLPDGCLPLILAISEKTARAWQRPALDILISAGPTRSDMLELTRKALDSDSPS